MADPDAGLRQWLRQYAKDHPRRGFRPAYHDARADGWAVNHKKIQRLWREEDLRVPQRRRRKRLGTSTANPPKADAPNRVQFDASTDGRPINIVSIVDVHTTTTTTDADTAHSATDRQRSTLLAAPTNDRLSHGVDQFSESGQTAYFRNRRSKDEWEPLREPSPSGIFLADQ